MANISSYIMLFPFLSSIHTIICFNLGITAAAWIHLDEKQVYLRQKAITQNKEYMHGVYD